ncbi:MAG: FIG01030056: hypothetical protein [uncultured Rubrobacteraceae bacterium]|uniref:Glycosyltransferase RgtA/B/C/D-like domain-containing protein n=1 Tax=uncultured Rubrobacteraceae bacterium TaxID=349277 RepID=A0A6J4QW61_9ACTN|nr:MAG: FIG01030056: hypothetical protein [uncultured Rubrobacteraceae bacterium]
MLLNLILASFAALAVGAAPGWFWATLLRAPVDLAERAALSVAFSMALVPAVALVPTRLFGLGVTLPVAAGSALAVFVAGLAAHLRFGAAKGVEGPLLPSPAVPLSTPALVPLMAALGLALGVMVGALPADAVLPAITGGMVPTRSMVLVIALLVLATGVLHLIFSRRSAGTVEPASLLPAVPPTVRRLLLPAILLLVLARGYVGPVLHDWPFMRGVDHYSHAVMANRMMEVGRIEPYLIYPPGFHTMTASISRLTGLDPLEIFPVLGPALLLLPALALYTLGTRLWGWGYGVAAAFFTVLLGGTYYYFNDAMYPNLVTSQFLLVMALASLVMVYRAPSARNGLSLAILGSGVVLYHPVASMYLAVLLALAGLFFVPPLLVRSRRAGLALTLSLALLGALSVAYAWHTYDLGSEFSQLLGGSGGATGEAVGMAVNTQAAYPEGFLIGTMVSQPVAWLGLLGVFLLVVRARDSFGMPAALAHLTVFLWAVLLFAGSRLTVTGFPQRFGRDLGVPLALLAALGLIAVLKSLGPGRRPVAIFAASAVVLLSLSLAGTGAAQSLRWSVRPSIQMTVTPAIAEAGRWLEEHNEGGNIMVSPHVNQVPSRMMLAMGDYSALQSFEYAQILRPRDLPPTGPEPLMDVLRTVTNPAGERATSTFEKYDVRYVVLYKNMPDRPTADYWRRFEARPDLYPTVFENRDVLIVQTT